MKFQELLKSFRGNEEGVGTVMALFWFILCAGIVGLSVDATNAWRLKERLQLSADVASHAGIIRVLEGDTATDIRAAARASALSNMPGSGFGQVINQDIKDIVLSTFDPSSNTLAAPGSVNAVTVQLHRSDTVNNPVGTYLLGFAGFPDFQVRRYGTSVVSDFGECPNYEGIWAHGYIDLPGPNTIGPDYCLHSQDYIWPAQNNTFEPGSHLSMPSLARCRTKCYDTENTGIEDAKQEINLIMPTFDDVITAAYGSFDGRSGSVHDSFWYGDGDIATTSDNRTYDHAAVVANWNVIAGENWPPSKAPLDLGEVVELTVAEFESMDKPPSGLTYRVTCQNNGNGVNTRLNLDPTSTGDPVRDIAVITNCSIIFEDYSDWQGTAVISTRQRSNATLTASAEATVGDQDTTCDPKDHTFLMARADMNVAAKFLASNVTVVTAGDIQIASGASPGIDYHGMTLYADGRVQGTSQHKFYACGFNNGDVIDATGYKYIRQVLPTNEADRLAAVN